MIDVFLEKIKQISSRKKVVIIVAKTTFSQLQSKFEILHAEKTILQNTLTQKYVCIDSLNKEKTVYKIQLLRKKNTLKSYRIE